jgi:hypothetical protein
VGAQMSATTIWMGVSRTRHRKRPLTRTMSIHQCHQGKLQSVPRRFADPRYGFQYCPQPCREQSSRRAGKSTRSCETPPGTASPISIETADHEHVRSSSVHYPALLEEIVLSSSQYNTEG